MNHPPALPVIVVPGGVEACSGIINGQLGRRLAHTGSPERHALTPVAWHPIVCLHRLPSWEKEEAHGHTTA
jgi:hypothetical protein